MIRLGLPKPHSARSSARYGHEQLSHRAAGVAVVIALFVVFFLGQLIRVQVFNAHDTAMAAQANRTLKATLSAKRGKITDVNGTVLAQSVERYTIIGNPEAAQAFEPTKCTKQTQDYCHALNGKDLSTSGVAAVSQLLAPVLGMNASELGGKLSGVGQYAVLKKDVTPETKRKIDALHLGGIIYGTLSNERLYSNGTLMGTLLGGVDAEGKGVSGIEQMEDKLLTGTDGYEIYQQGLGGEQIPGTLTESKDAVNGQTVTLTIDRDVQWQVEKILLDAQKTYKAAWGIAVVQDVKTGEIRALADTDTVEAGSDDAKLNVSRAVSETFEPGSIGKVFTLSGLLQEQQHKMTDRFTVPDTITINGQTYKDAENHGAEHWTLAGVLQQSSNVGTIMASENYPDNLRYQYLKKFGIGQPSGLTLPGESQGILRPDTTWDGRTRNTVLFGQGYTTNALQITNAVAVIANKGVHKPQTIIKSTTDAQGRTTPYHTDGKSERVVDESVAKDVLNAMESVSDNYSKFASVKGFRVGAKSGTAEVPDANGNLTSTISDYSAIIPADNPQFVVTVVLKDPQGVFGGLTAGPVFAQIGQFLMQKYEVPNSAPRTDAIPVDW
ncbi:peptidoglycan D,D-transpeptidase FtsI family protein [Bifidobacterium gallicum]|uniref:Cell division protein n=1 Tax=Bifidobacterium gallicum DSM 20093 = LMG 11596 TaxID=561180 RepID=D1NSW5_9BIFI|nr:penicillin-binding protein 2 [Bifidobacterium gallicum]EFA23767.1 penicillin-binding protein, transpeptidase domain protein [Bifidobacterium gallicum DSM 20093 = LMG 11596]KFI59220.1 cell division protein [Bifidobacterium gallicum DSM 20093 = LMG 11596]